MKQLKFMLAAAAAFGIATAQAEAIDKELVNEDFNNYPDTMTGAAITNTTTGIPGFSFIGAEGDNESAIIKQAEGDMALKVNTGTAPLLRALDYQSSVNDLDFADEEAAINSVTIDTTVEFTVTPEGDTVAATDDDKLLIYLKEETVDDVKSYALRVVTAEYTPATPPPRPGQDGTPAVFNRTDVKISNKTIEPNTPYSLQVTTKKDDDGVIYFEITLDGTKLQSATSLHPAGLDKFPSRVYEGEKVSTLTYVGFAGEGTVDDLVVTKNYNAPDAVDFTFVVKWDTGISAVAYTISEDGTTSEAAPVPADGFSVPEGATVELAVTLKDSEWTKLADGTVLKFENVVADKTDIDLKTVKIAQKEDANGNVVVNPDASASDVGINSDSAFAGADAEKLGEVLTWAKNASVTVDQINKMTFSTAGDPAGVTDADKLVEEAYLLNCTTAEVENKKKSFKISANDLAKLLKDGALTQLDVDSNLYNGKVVIEGRDDLSEGTWEITEQGNSHKFYRARLVFPSAVAE